MIYTGLLLAALATTPQTPPKNSVVKQVTDSGRCADLAESPDKRVEKKPQVAPGAPPILSFRFYEGKLHHCFGNSELLLDDAGH